MLECTVCLDRVKDPHTLQQCLHTYCKECIDQLLQTQNNHPPGVKCPVCQNVSGKNEIRSNFFIKDLVNVHSSNTENIQRICEQRDGEMDNRNPSYKCLDCRILLCESCKKGHLRLKLLQGHRVISITEDTEDVIDKLVFCSIHPDKPIELYCEPCKLPLCMKCKVTKHIQHDTKTTEDALEELVPEMQESIKNVDNYIHVNIKSIQDVEAKILEVKKAYSDCYEEINTTAEERIKDIKVARKKLQERLNKEEGNEIKKLEDIKDSLYKKQKEGENLKRVVLTSLDKARHATLLTELVQGGLHDKVKAIKETKLSQVQCKINLPKVAVFKQSWSKMKQNGLLGNLMFNAISTLTAIGSSMQKTAFTCSSYSNKTFLELFGEKWMNMLEIKVKDACTRVALIKDRIWVPMADSNFIEIYSKTGQLVKKINIASPVSVTATDDNAIFAAGCHGSGLCVIKDLATPVKLYEGSFSDIYYFHDKIYAMEYAQKFILEYCHNANTKLAMKLKQTRKIHLDNYESPHLLDKLIVTNLKHIGSHVCFYVSSWKKHKIYKFNEQGQQIMIYQGESNLLGPLLCGIDSQSQLLVADSFNNEYKILDPENGQWSNTGLNGKGEVFDAKIDNEGVLWLSQHNGNNYLISKHQHSEE